MSKNVSVRIDVPGELARFRLPKGVNDRLQLLLDKQSAGEKLSAKERREAEGLVDLAELLTLLRLRTERASRRDKST